MSFVFQPMEIVFFIPNVTNYNSHFYDSKVHLFKAISKNCFASDLRVFTRKISTFFLIEHSGLCN